MARKRKSRKSKISPNVKSSILQAIRENMERLENLATVITPEHLGKDAYTKGPSGDQYSKSDKETYSKGPPDDNYTKSTMTIIGDLVNPVELVRATTKKAGQE
jgi:hypothetical protein